MQPNWANRTMWTGDNLEIMRGMNSESVDLIYLDPPFNSNRNYEAPIGSKAAGAAFKDTWTLSDVDVAWHGYLSDKEPALNTVITAARETHGKSMMSYLIMMGIRLIEMRRLLKPTASIFLHCDPTAGHYLKLLMDALFGVQNFRNEIIWSYEKWTNTANYFQRNHDTILFYAVGPDNKFNKLYGQLTTRQQQMMSTGYNLGSSSGRKIVRIYNRNNPNVTKRLAIWESEGRAIYDVSPPPGKAISAVWQIPFLNGQAKERVGYPTQKPLALLKRIIKASTGQGDVVCDPFAGCATACVAAEMLGRQWVGIDISPKATELVRIRIEQMIDLFGEKIIRRDTPPKRTDVKTIPRYGSHKHELYGQQAGYCNGCGTHFQLRNFTIDHKIPQSQGGTDHIDNLQLLCGACNSLKGNRDMPYLLAALKRQDR